MKKEILQGFIIGLLSNTIGITICVFIISNVKDMSVFDTFSFYLSTGNLWMIISLGALTNLLVFFWLLKRNKEYKARGVVMATFLAAISIYIIYFF